LFDQRLFSHIFLRTAKVGKTFLFKKFYKKIKRRQNYRFFDVFLLPDLTTQPWVWSSPGGKTCAQS
jgi:hypothetical protein